MTISFSAQVVKFGELARKRAELVVKKTTLDLLSSVVLNSPVDTGRFRGNWQVGIGSAVLSELNRTDKSGSETLAAAQSVIVRAKLGDVIHLTNNLPYARRLEYGWSKQAPQGMVRVAVARFQETFKKATGAAGGRV